MPGLTRHLSPEILDQLPADDPVAIRSRQNLRRINWFMRNDAIIAAACRQIWTGRPPERLVDLGAGDGTLLAGVERRLARHWPDLAVTLVDRLALGSPRAGLPWRAEFVLADVVEWLNTVRPLSVDIMIANLFLHHSTAAELAVLLAGVARTVRLFVACEPRRSRRALFGCRLLGATGCNHVTRHDAWASVHAGFTGRELSALWPLAAGWQLMERPAGPFSHLFAACRQP